MLSSPTVAARPSRGDFRGDEMAKKPADLSGQTFAQFTVICLLKQTYWLCRCSCGSYRVHMSANLKNQNAKDCGCIWKNRLATHRLKGTSVYKAWQSMRQRCYNQKAKEFKGYGARGISVCDRWKSSFDNFLTDLGHPEKGMWLERNDVNGNYEPDNCRWATPTEQGRNKRNNILITAFGKTKCLSAWAVEYSIHYYTLTGRIKLGWDAEKALSQPPRFKTKLPQEQ